MRDKQKLREYTRNTHIVILRKCKNVCSQFIIFNLVKHRDPKELKKAKTTGKGWYDMEQPEITDEMIMDIKAIKMRNLIYKKRFYKGNDTRELPKFFQVTTFISYFRSARLLRTEMKWAMKN